MYETYIPGFTNELWGGAPETMSVDGGLTGSYQSLPTAQPVQTAPYVENYQSQPTAQPIMAVPYTESYQSQPTAQPVQSEPYYPPLDLGDWSISTMQNLYNNPALSTTALNQYLADQTAAGKDVVSLNPYGSGGGFGPDSINANIWNAYNQFDPNNPGATTGEVVRFDTGNQIGVPDGNGGFTYRNSAPVVVQPGMTYTLTDYDGNVLGTGSTAEELQKLVTLADQNAAATGWNLYQGDPVAGTQLFNRAPQDNTLKNMLLAAGTAIGASYLGPFIQGAGAVAPGAVGAAATPLGAGLAAAGVNTAGNLVTGASLSDALKSGALAGLSTAALSGLMGELGLGAKSAPNVGDLQMNTIDALTALGVNPELAGQIASGPLSGIGSAGGGGLGAGGGSIAGTDALGNFIQVPGRVIGSNIPSSFLSGALGATSGALSGTNYGDQVFNQPSPQDQTLEQQFDDVFKAPTTVYGNVGPNAGAIGSPGVSVPVSSTPAVTEGAGWDVLAPKENSITPPSAILPEIIPPLSSVDIPAGAGTQLPEIPAEDGWTVEAPPRAPDLLPEIVPPLTSVDIPTDAGNVTPTDGKGGLSTMDYIRLASLGIGALGDLFGGNKNAPGAKISGSMGGLNPVFGAQLPGANLPGLSGSTGGTRPATQSGLNTTQDWYRYGYGPEQSFFNYVPMGQPNTSRAYTGYAEGGSTGYGEGGGLGQYVEGPGDGREDKIPAMLSDGEYVIDAETVALLGNGSNKAGADLLDKFRVNVRKHKGRELARGDFSKDAKRPEQYLAGGRT